MHKTHRFCPCWPVLTVLLPLKHNGFGKIGAVKCFPTYVISMNKKATKRSKNKIKLSKYLLEGMMMLKHGGGRQRCKTVHV